MYFLFKYEGTGTCCVMWLLCLQCCFCVSSKKSDLVLHQNAEDSPDDIYGKLGGIIHTDKGDIHSSIDVLSETFLTSPVVIQEFQLRHKSGHVTTFNIDDTIKAFLVDIRSNHTKPMYDVFTPKGTHLVVNKKHARYMVNSETVQVVKITSPTIGQWKLQLNDDQHYDVVIRASSAVDFDYMLMKPGGPYGYMRLDGNPIAGSNYRLVNTVDGIDDIRGLTNISFLALNGTVLHMEALKDPVGRGHNTYISDVKFPNQPFLLEVTGEDKHNNTLTRVKETPIEPQTVDLKITDSGSGNIMPGHNYTITYHIHNYGRTGTFQITATVESFTFKTYIDKSALKILHGGNATGNVIIHAMKKTRPDTTGKLILAVSDPMGNSQYADMLLIVVSDGVPTTTVQPVSATTQPVSATTQPVSDTSLPICETMTLSGPCDRDSSCSVVLFDVFLASLCLFVLSLCV